MPGATGSYEVTPTSDVPRSFPRPTDESDPRQQPRAGAKKSQAGQENDSIQHLWVISYLLLRYLINCFRLLLVKFEFVVTNP